MNKARTSLVEISRSLVIAATDLGTIYGDLASRSVPSIHHERTFRKSLDTVSLQTAAAMRVLLELQTLAARLELASRAVE